MSSVVISFKIFGNPQVSRSWKPTFYGVCGVFVWRALPSFVWSVVMESDRCGSSSSAVLRVAVRGARHARAAPCPRRGTPAGARASVSVRPRAEITCRIIECRIGCYVAVQRSVPVPNIRCLRLSQWILLLCISRSASKWIPADSTRPWSMRGGSSAPRPCMS